VPGVFVDDQLRVQNVLCHIGTVHGGHHEVVIAIRDQYRDSDVAKILRCGTPLRGPRSR
jgi:hypothetical protein